MLKRSSALIVPAVVLAIAAPLATASGASHTLKLTLHSFTVSSSSKSDAPGTKQDGVGIVTGQPFGQAVSTLHDKVIKASRSELKFAGRFTIYTVHGSLTGKIHFTVKPRSNGGATGSGGGQMIGGTGRYQGAHGSFHFTGSQGPKAPDFTARLTGNVSY